MAKKSNYKKPTTINQARDNFRYQGKIVVEAGGKIFTARTGKRAQELIKKVQKNYPNETPIVTYLPKKDQIVIPTLVDIKGERKKKSKKKRD